MIYSKCFIIGLFLLMSRIVKSHSKKGFHVQHFRSSSFLWLTRENDTMIMLDDFHFRISLCTVLKDGLIIKVSNRKQLPVLIIKETISIMMKNGKIRFHYKDFDSDKGCTLTADPKVNDGSWHDVEVHWDGQSIEILLDSSESYKETYFAQKHSADNLIEDIILGGGVTLHANESMYNVYDDFQGCMMNTRLNKRPLDDIFSLSFESNVDEGCSTDNDCQKVKCPSPMSFTKRECRCPGDMIATDDGEACRRQCRNDFCLNGGICIEKGLEITCNCSAGYSGPTCSTDDPCSLLPCLNNGTCRNNGSQFVCHCPKDFHGKKCQDHHKKSHPQPYMIVSCVLGFVLLAIIIGGVYYKCRRNRSKPTVNDITTEGGNQGQHLPGNTNLSQNLRNQIASDSSRTRPSVFQQMTNCCGISSTTSGIDDRTNGNLMSHKVTQTDEVPKIDRNNRVNNKGSQTDRNIRVIDQDSRKNRNREHRQTERDTQDEDSGIDENPETNGDAPITDGDHRIDEDPETNGDAPITDGDHRIDEDPETNGDAPITDGDHRIDEDPETKGNAPDDSTPETDDNTLVIDENP